jgi:hypothetical protein
MWGKMANEFFPELVVESVDVVFLGFDAVWAAECLHLQS